MRSVPVKAPAWDKVIIENDSHIHKPRRHHERKCFYSPSWPPLGAVDLHPAPALPDPMSHDLSSGTVVMQVTANDADDATYGNSARVVYSILQGQPYFSVEPETGNLSQDPSLSRPHTHSHTHTHTSSQAVKRRR